MSTPVANLQIVVKTLAGVVVETLTTDANGHASVSLAPGKYKAEVSELSEYSFKEGSLLEPGEQPVALSSLTVLDIDVVSGQTTTCNVEFLED